MTASHAFHRSGTYKTAKNETKTKGNKIDRSSNKTDEMQIAKKSLHCWMYIQMAIFLRRLFKNSIVIFTTCELEGESGLCR